MTSSQQIPISLPAAQLNWDTTTANALPLSPEYDDSYYSRDNGYAESQHVFIDGNQLRKRFPRSKQFCIAETGFGTGLNCYAALAAWQAHKPPCGHLHFISCEKHPMAAADIRLALSEWPELKGVSEQILAGYPQNEKEFCRGYWNISLPELSAKITLLFGDADEMLSSLDAQVDAWFLDGFAPSRNSSMWNQEVFDEIARLSNTGTTLATFTAARAVRDALNNAGFATSRIKGFGRKRHMTTATFADTSNRSQRQSPPLRPTPNAAQDTIVVGSGIAACTTAALLAEQGVSVKLLYAGEGLANAASGIPQATIRPYFDANHSSASAFYLQSYLATLRATEGITERLDIEQVTKTENNWISTLFKRFDIHSSLAFSDTENVLCYPGAATINLKAWCEHLIKNAREKSGLRTFSNQKVISLRPASSGWVVQTASQQWHCSNVILCTGAEIPTIQCDSITTETLRLFRGQASGFPRNNPQPSARCGNGHIIHSKSETWFGASYIPNDRNNGYRESEFSKYSAKANTLDTTLIIPEFKDCQHFAGTRSSTADHLPLVGPAPDYKTLENHYQDWHRFPHTAKNKPNSNLTGLYFNLAHGSKGATSALLSADIIASYLLRQPLPVSQQVAKALHPNRYKLRELRKSDT